MQLLGRFHLPLRSPQRPRALRGVGTVITACAAVTVLLAACGGGSVGGNPVSSPKTSSSASGRPSVGSTQPVVPTPSISGTGGAQALQDAYTSISAAILPSVVQVSTSQGLGSGIVYNTKGDIVTNNHVVNGATTLQVTTYQGKTYQAAVVGTYAEDDLAVIHVSGANLKPAAFGVSNKLEVGDIVMAIGNPLGLDSSVTAGIVSATNRTESETNGVVLSNMIQTSAEINPGNSGGALVNLNGQVVGIPTLGAIDPQFNGAAAAGIGFAIPSDTVTSIANQLIATGHISSSGRAYLGVELSISSLQTTNGAQIITVTPNTPASKAGIAAGDIITAVGTTQITNDNDLAVALAALTPGDKVAITYLDQNNSSHTVEVTLAQLPGSAN